MANPNPDQSGLLPPVKPGEQRAKKDERLHLKPRSIRFSDKEWQDLREYAEQAGKPLSAIARDRLLSLLK